MRAKRSLAAAAAGVAAVAAHDLIQKQHSILRNYPVVGHLRFLLEKVRPEIQQYFIERNWDGRPFDREVRTTVYERSKGIHGEQAFGTERDVNEVGHEWLVHAMHTTVEPSEPPTVTIGGPNCARPYEMALLNVSAMSFGSLSANAIRALNKGASLGGFAHDTGEGGITPYHLEFGGDLIWEIGTAYFGCRTPEGTFDPAKFADRVGTPAVKAVVIKLSQGAKPGLGGVLPAAKVTPEVAEFRGIPVGVKCVSPPSHSAFSTPREMIRFIVELRELSGGLPVGIKFCVGDRVDVLAICKAMIDEGTGPDFVVVDGSEGGTGAGPLEFEDHVGMPLTPGLMTVHNAFVGAGLRHRIRIGASGKVATASDIVKRLCQGADYTNSARAMMMAIGCIQAQACHTNRCPVGVTTQDPRRTWALDVHDKGDRVHRFQQATVAEVSTILAAMGVTSLDQLGPQYLQRNVSITEHRTYAEIYEWLQPGALLASPPESWAADWAVASADHFGRHGSRPTA